MNWTARRGELFSFGPFLYRSEGVHPHCPHTCRQQWGVTIRADMDKWELFMGLTCTTDGSALQTAWFCGRPCGCPHSGAALLYPRAVHGSPPGISIPLWLRGTASGCCGCHVGAGKTRVEASKAEPGASESFISRALFWRRSQAGR